MNDERPGQFYCMICGIPVGFSGQPAAYSSLRTSGCLCPKHNVAEEKEMQREQA